MKRLLIALITALSLTVGAAAAQADGPGFPGFPGDTGTPQAAVGGTVVSVDAAAGTFVANAYLLTPPSMGSGGSDDSSGGFGGFDGFGGLEGSTRSLDVPAPTQVTITTNSSTTIRVGDTSGATLGDLVPGARFLALFPASSTDTLQAVVASPATSIFAQVPKQVYAFVGTVTGTSTTANTITVDVMRSLPSGLLGSGTSATFTLSPHTFIIGGSSLTSTSEGGLFGGLFGGSLSSVSTGDMVAGGLIGDAGLTAAQVQASPLTFLLDLPAPASTTSGTASSAAKSALKETLKLLHGAKVKVKKAHGKKGHKSHHAGRR